MSTPAPIATLDGHALSVRALCDAVLSAFAADLPVHIAADGWKRPSIQAVIEAATRAAGRTGEWTFIERASRAPVHADAPVFTPATSAPAAVVALEVHQPDPEPVAEPQVIYTPEDFAQDLASLAQIADVLTPELSEADEVRFTEDDEAAFAQHAGYDWSPSVTDEQVEIPSALTPDADAAHGSSAPSVASAVSPVAADLEPVEHEPAEPLLEAPLVEPSFDGDAPVAVGEGDPEPDVQATWDAMGSLGLFVGEGPYVEASDALEVAEQPPADRSLADELSGLFNDEPGGSALPPESSHDFLGLGEPEAPAQAAVDHGDDPHESVSWLAPSDDPVAEAAPERLAADDDLEAVLAEPEPVPVARVIPNLEIHQAAIGADPTLDGAYALFAFQQPVMVRSLRKRPSEFDVPAPVLGGSVSSQDVLRELAALDDL